MNRILTLALRNIGLIVLGACVVWGAGDICAHVDKLRHAEQARLDALEQKIDSANALNAKLQTVAAAIPAWQLEAPKAVEEKLVVGEYRPSVKPSVPQVRR